MKSTKRQVVKAARLFLMWFEPDGKPVDGFRFREQYRELSKVVGYEKWQKKRFKPKTQKKSPTP